MMYRKNRWILALVLILALMLAGCGSSEEPQAGTVVAASQPETAPETEAAVPETETAPAETEAPTVPEEDENPLSLGVMEGGTYLNAYAGFGCDLDENWTIYGAGELQPVSNEVLDAMEGTELAAMMENYTQLMDMRAENSAALASVNVIYVKQDLATQMAYRLLTDEEIMDAALEQKDVMIEGYAQAGILVSSMEKVQVDFLGEKTWGIKTVGDMDLGNGQTIPYYILQVFNYRAGSYAITLTCGTFLEDHTEETLGMFYPVN